MVVKMKSFSVLVFTVVSILTIAVSSVTAAKSSLSSDIKQQLAAALPDFGYHSGSRSLGINLNELLPSKNILEKLDALTVNGFCHVVETVAKIHLADPVEIQHIRHFLIGSCHVSKRALDAFGPEKLPKCQDLVVVNGICEGVCQVDSDCKFENGICARNSYCYGVPLSKDNECGDSSYTKVKSDYGGLYCEKVCTSKTTCPPGAGCLKDKDTKVLSCTGPCQDDGDCPIVNGKLKCGDHGYCV